MAELKVTKRFPFPTFLNLRISDLDTGTREEKLSALHYLHWAQVIAQNKYFSSQLCWNFQSQSHQLCPKCSSVLAETINPL